MTAAPIDQAAASRLVAVLEDTWATIRSHHPDVPQVVIVVASGSDPRSRRLNLGHFARLMTSNCLTGLCVAHTDHERSDFAARLRLAARHP